MIDKQVQYSTLHWWAPISAKQPPAVLCALFSALNLWSMHVMLHLLCKNTKLSIEHTEFSIIVLVVAIEGQHREEPNCAEIHF